MVVVINQQYFFYKEPIISILINLSSLKYSPECTIKQIVLFVRLSNFHSAVGTKLHS